MIEISVKLLSAIARFASLDDSRPNLRCVRFTPKKIVAVDGVKLVRVRTSGVESIKLSAGSDSFEPFHLQRETIEAIDRLTKGRGQIRLTRHGVADLIKIDLDEHHGLGLTTKPKAIHFPPTEAVTTLGRETETPPRWTVSPAFFADIHAVIDALRIDFEGVTVTGWGDRISPVQLEAASGAVRFTIMGMRE